MNGKVVKMKKLLYINLSFLNYKNKALAQMLAFERNGYITYVGTIQRYEQIVEQSINLVKNGEVVERVFYVKYNSNTAKTISRLYLLEVYRRFYLWIKDNQVDIVYMRRMLQRIVFSRSFFKKSSVVTKLVYELPTYPLDPSDKIGDQISQFIEMGFYYCFIEKYVDIVPVCLQKECVLPKKYLPFVNGVNALHYRPIGTPELKNKFVCVAFAHVRYWHGFERVIRGISAYQGTFDIEFHIYSSENDTTEALKLLTSDLNLSRAVFIHNLVDIGQMAMIAKDCHIGVGGLAYHKRGATIDSSIKSKEYCALGLPFLYEVPDMAFDKEWEYHYKIPSDESPVDFEKVINWYKSLPKEHSVVMHKYAEDNLQFDNEVRDIERRLQDIMIEKKRDRGASNYESNVN